MHQKKLFLLAGFAFVTLGVHAQQAASAAGGNASGSGGSASYTVGQVAYTTNSGTTGTVLQGVQQPYEIYVTSGIENTMVNLNISTYPNPTRDNLMLSIDNLGNANFVFQLFDSNGKLVSTGNVTENKTIISMEQLAAGSYFVRVANKSTEVKTFKIIKN